MAKIKKKLTIAQKRARKKAKAERQKKYMWVFMNGKQIRVRRRKNIKVACCGANQYDIVHEDSR